LKDYSADSVTVLNVEYGAYTSDPSTCTLAFNGRSNYSGAISYIKTGHEWSSNAATYISFWTRQSNANGAGTDEKLRIRYNGDVTGTYGDYHVSSDIRRKKDIVTIPNALDKVLALRGVNFKWKDPSQDDNLHMGMIAQEVEKVVPEVVHTADDEMRIKAVEYQYMVGLLVEAIKEQQRQIQALRQDIEQLERNL